MTDRDTGVDRRLFLNLCAGLGLAGTVLPDILCAADIGNGITTDQLVAAEALAGLQFTDEERRLMLDGLDELRLNYQRLREVSIDNAVPPALLFDPELGGPVSRQLESSPGAPNAAFAAPKDRNDIAHLPATALGAMIRDRRMSSVELTEFYLERLRRFNPQLECVITLTEDRAIRLARRADEELARGIRRGPLHGVPWGAKDLLAVEGYPTTWGAAPYKNQVIDHDATVVQRLDDAGAVLVAKLSLGALAWGDVWFGGTTKNPWNLEQGSSGSSAGPAAATAAGLVGFSIGSETWGSIVSPSTRCGVSGLRPTFGRVSRAGAMALSWSMDKLGPMCRTVEDCAVVFDAISGPDGLDPTVVDRPLTWARDMDLKPLRIGYVSSAFEAEPEGDTEEELAVARESRDHDLATLDELRSMGLTMVPMELPELPVEALSFILSAEAAAAFDELTRSGRDDELVRQIEEAWPNEFRTARTIPAVEYIQANRVRTLVMREMARVMDDIDVYVCPSFGGDNLLLTNLTGHPSVVVPNGFTHNGSPTSITFCGRLYGESETLAVALAYQEATGFHLEHPPLG